MLTKTFKKGELVFRASPDKSEYKKRPHLFASYNKDGYESVKRIYAKYEGNQVHTYTVDKDLKLIDMSKPQNVIELLNSTNDSKNIQAIKKAFRVTNGNAGIVRFSRMKYDARVADLICKLGYDGYITPKLPERYGNSKVLQEVLICKAGDKVKHTASNKVINKPLKPPSLRPASYYNNKNNENDNDSLFERALNGNFRTPPSKKRRMNTPSPVRGSGVVKSLFEMITP